MSAAETGGPARKDPDWVYETDDWEATFEFGDRGDLFDNFSRDKITTVGCLKNLPDQFAVYVVTEKDADGDIIHGEWELFPTLKAAQSAFKKSHGEKP